MSIADRQVDMSTEIFKDLLVTEKDLLRDAVAKAKDLIGIEESTGRVIVRVPESRSDSVSLLRCF